MSARRPSLRAKRSDPLPIRAALARYVAALVAMTAVSLADIVGGERLAGHAGVGDKRRRFRPHIVAPVRQQEPMRIAAPGARNTRHLQPRPPVGVLVQVHAAV